MAKKILVVVDAQNDFITGVLGNKECDVATNVIAEEIRSGKYDDVIFTRDTHDENYLNTQEGKKDVYKRQSQSLSVTAGRRMQTS